MAIYYIDPTWTGTASGTFAQPWTTYASLPALSAGDKVLLKEGTTFVGTVLATASGTSGSRIVYGVYNANGNEVTNKVGAATIQGDGTNNDNFNTSTYSWVTVSCLNFTQVRAARYGIVLGDFGSANGCSALYCKVVNQSGSYGVRVKTNTGIGAHSVLGGEFSGNIYGIAIEGTLTGVSVDIRRNLCQYNSEAGIRSALSTSSLMTGVIKENVCTFNGTLQQVDSKGIGIDILSDTDRSFSLIDNICSNNWSIGIRAGTFSGLVNRQTISGNTCNFNGYFGIQVNRGTGCLIANNTCNSNGCNRDSKWGRGIEIYSSNPSFPAASVRVVNNTCNYNKNYGGTLNNGTEGCGIGLDNNHGNILVMGNTLIGNDGNGIQFNPSGAVGTSIIVGNYLQDNYLVDSDRITSSWEAHSRAQIGLFTTENNVKIYNNTIVNTVPNSSCTYGISESTTAAGTGTVVVNNFFVGHTVGLNIRTGVTRTHNAFLNNTINVTESSTGATIGDGTGAVVSGFLLDSFYRPTVGSSLIGAGTYVGRFLGADNQEFRVPMGIGAFSIALTRGLR